MGHHVLWVMLVLAPTHVPTVLGPYPTVREWRCMWHGELWQGEDKLAGGQED